MRRALRVGIVELAVFLIVITALFIAAWAQAPGGKPVEGTLTIAKKTYKLTSVVAYESLFFDKPVITVLACDKTIPVDKLRASLAKDGTDDSFMLWEPNIRVTFDAEGKPMSMNCWADNHSLSISGSDLAGGLSVKDGVAHGKFSLTKSDEEGRGCEFIFNTPLIANAKAKQGAVKKESAETPNDDDPLGKKSADKPQLSIYQLPLPKDAANLEYKTLVEQLAFTSATDYKALAKSFGDQLAAAGWKKDDSELVGQKSAILKRKQGAAEMTIFIKPAEKGSAVLIMTEGLSWEKPK